MANSLLDLLKQQELQRYNEAKAQEIQLLEKDPDAYWNMHRQRSLAMTAEQNKQDMNFASRALFRGANQLGEMASGAAGLAGSALGIDGLKEWGIEKAVGFSEAAQTYPGVEYDGIATAPLWVLDKAIENAPLMVSTMGVGIGVGTATKMIFRNAVKSVVGKELLKAGVEKASGKVIESVAKDRIFNMASMAAKASTVLSIGSLESGGNYSELSQMGIDNPLSSVATGMTAGLVELMGGNIRLIDIALGKEKASIFSKAVNRVSKSIANKEIPKVSDYNILRRMVKEAITESPAEAVQEGLQESLSLLNIAVNDPAFEAFTVENISRVGEAMAAGGAVGSLYGAAGGALKSQDTAIREDLSQLSKEEQSSLGETILGSAQKRDQKKTQSEEDKAQHRDSLRILSLLNQVDSNKLFEEYVQEYEMATDDAQRQAIYKKLEDLIGRGQEEAKPGEAKTTEKKQPAAKVAQEQKQHGDAGQTEQQSKSNVQEPQEQVDLPTKEEMSQIGDDDIAKQMELESIRGDMDDTTVSKVEERVQELGSFEETQRQFTADDKASKYAHAYARMLYGENSVKGKEAAQGTVQEQQQSPVPAQEKEVVQEQQESKTPEVNVFTEQDKVKERQNFLQSNLDMLRDVIGDEKADNITNAVDQGKTHTFFNDESYSKDEQDFARMYEEIKYPGKDSYGNQREDERQRISLAEDSLYTIEEKIGEEKSLKIRNLVRSGDKEKVLSGRKYTRTEKDYARLLDYIGPGWDGWNRDTKSTGDRDEDGSAETKTEEKSSKGDNLPWDGSAIDDEHRWRGIKVKLTAKVKSKRRPDISGTIDRVYNDGRLLDIFIGENDFSTRITAEDYNIAIIGQKDKSQELSEEPSKPLIRNGAAKKPEIAEQTIRNFVEWKENPYSLTEETVYDPECRDCEDIVRTFAEKTMETGEEVAIYKMEGFKGKITSGNTVKPKNAIHYMAQVNGKYIDFTGSQFGEEYGGIRILTRKEVEKEWENIEREKKVKEPKENKKEKQQEVVKDPMKRTFQEWLRSILHPKTGQSIFVGENWQNPEGGEIMDHVSHVGWNKKKNENFINTRLIYEDLPNLPMMTITKKRKDNSITLYDLYLKAKEDFPELFINDSADYEQSVSADIEDKNVKTFLGLMRDQSDLTMEERLYGKEPTEEDYENLSSDLDGEGEIADAAEQAVIEETRTNQGVLDENYQETGIQDIAREEKVSEDEARDAFFQAIEDLSSEIEEERDMTPFPDIDMYVEREGDGYIIVNAEGKILFPREGTLTKEKALELAQKQQDAFTATQDKTDKNTIKTYPYLNYRLIEMGDGFVVVDENNVQKYPRYIGETFKSTAEADRAVSKELEDAANENQEQFFEVGEKRDDDNLLFSMTEVNADELFQPKLIEVLETKLMNKGEKRAVLKNLEDLMNKGHIKKEEIESTGIFDSDLFLGEGKITRQEVIDYINQNRMNIVVRLVDDNYPPDVLDLADEIMKAGKKSKASGPQVVPIKYDWSHATKATIVYDEKSRNYEVQFEGTIGKFRFNRKEELSDYLFSKARIRKNNALSTKYRRWKIPGGDNYRELLLNYINSNIPEYISPHFENTGLEDNLFAHARITDRETRNGETITFIEEIQSDLHQEGEKGGYRGNRDSLIKVRKKFIKKINEKREKEFNPKIDYDGAIKIVERNIEILEKEQEIVKKFNEFERRNGATFEELYIKDIVEYAKNNKLFNWPEILYRKNGDTVDYLKFSKGEDGKIKVEFEGSFYEKSFDIGENTGREIYQFINNFLKERYGEDNHSFFGFKNLSNNFIFLNNFISDLITGKWTKSFVAWFNNEKNILTEMSRESGDIDEIHPYLLKEFHYNVSTDIPFKNDYDLLLVKNVLIQAVKDGSDWVAWTPGNVHSKRWKGMGEENAVGLESFYDIRLSKTIKNYVKRLGGQIESVEMITSKPGEIDQYPWDKNVHTMTVPGFRITQKMREAVAEKLPLFSISADEYANPNMIPGFYSQMRQVFESKSLPDKGTGASYKRAMEDMAKSGKYKQEELEFSGLYESGLFEQKSVTKEEVLAFLNKDAVSITKKKLVDRPSLHGYKETHYDGHVMPGNYAEKYYHELLLNLNSRDLLYLSTHFGKDGRNLLAHARYTFREDGNKNLVLMVEEAQSDLHHDGREYGYVEKGRNKEEEVNAVTREIRSLEGELDGVKKLNESIEEHNRSIAQKIYEEDTRSAKDKFVEFIAKLLNTDGFMDKEGVHSTKNIYVDYGDAGFFRVNVIFNTLHVMDLQQKYFDEITYYKKYGFANTKETETALKEILSEYSIDYKKINLFSKEEFGAADNHKNYITQKGKQSLLKEKQLEIESEIVNKLKELKESRKGLMGRAPQVPFKKTWETLLLKNLVIEAVESGAEYIALTPGQVHFDRWGHGMSKEDANGLKMFYDERLRNIFSKYAKSMGSKLEKIKVNAGQYQEFEAFRISPKMKERVLQGQPLYSRAKERSLEELIERAIAGYGQTEDINKAMFIAPNGVMVGQSASGKQSHSLMAQRIANNSNATLSFLEMLRKGFVRVVPGDAAIEMGRNPNEEQKASLRRYISDRLLKNKSVTIDAWNKEGDVSSFVYHSGTSIDKIFSDLDSFYSGNHKAVSTVSQYHGSMIVNDQAKGKVPEKTVEEIVSRIQEELDVPVFLFENEDKLPPKFRGPAKRQVENGNLVEGMYDTESQSVLLVLRNIRDRQRLAEVLMHELVGHGGLRKIKEYRNFLSDILNNEEYADEITAIHKMRSKGGRNIDLLTVAEEWFASKVEEQAYIDKDGNVQIKIDHSLWTKFTSAIRRFLRKIGLDVKFNDTELKNLIRSSFEGIQRTQETGVQNRNTPIFDNILRILDNDEPKMSIIDSFRDRVTDKYKHKPDATGRFVFIDIDPPGFRSTLRHAFQDKLAWAQHFEDEIRRNKGFIQQSPVEMARLFYGRVPHLIEEFEKRVYTGKDSLIRRLQSAGYNINQAGEYLEAQMALEMNAHLRKNPKHQEKFGAMHSGSGMSDEVANQIIALPEYQNSEFLDIMKEVWKINRESLDIRFRSGLLTPESYNVLKDYYKHYVPLKIADKDDMRMFGNPSGGFSLKRYWEFRNRRGHDSKNVNPLVQSIMDYEESLVRSEKNRVNQLLAKMIEDNDSNMAIVIRPKYKPVYNTRGELSHVELDEPFLKPNQLLVKFAGKPLMVEFKDRMLAEGYLSMGEEKGMRWLYKINNWLRMVNTVFNPEFVFTNFSRDTQMALINLSGEVKNKDIVKGIMKNIPSAMKGIFANVYEKDDPNSKHWSDRYQELKELGGKVGWSTYRDVDQMSQELEKYFEKISREGDKNISLNKITDSIQHIGDFVKNVNEAVESGVRLATYDALVNRGVDKKKAALYAKGLTIDFNTKGHFGSILDSMYLFANAGIQGSFRVANGYFKNKTIRNICHGLVGFAFASTLWNRFNHGDEWDDFLEYHRDSSWLFSIPGLNKTIAIRVPYGYNVFAAAGNIIGDMVWNGITGKGNPDPMKSIARLYQAFSDGFMPISGGSVSQLLAPTAIDPLVMYAENKNFYGGKIYKEQSTFKSHVPESQRYFNDVGKSSKAFTTWLNHITGGNEVVSGYVDINPEAIDFAIESFFGGTGRTIENAVNTSISFATTGKADIKKVPFVRTMVAERSKWMPTQTVYDMLSNSDRKIFSEKQVDWFQRNLKQSVLDGSIERKDAKGYLVEFKSNQKDAKRSLLK